MRQARGCERRLSKQAPTRFLLCQWDGLLESVEIRKVLSKGQNVCCRGNFCDRMGKQRVLMPAGEVRVSMVSFSLDFFHRLLQTHRGVDFPWKCSGLNMWILAYHPQCSGPMWWFHAALNGTVRIYVDNHLMVGMISYHIYYLHVERSFMNSLGSHNFSLCLRRGEQFIDLIREY